MFAPEPGERGRRLAGGGCRPPMCDMIDSQSAEKISRMKKLRRTLSESFGRIGESRARALTALPGTRQGGDGGGGLSAAGLETPATAPSPKNVSCEESSGNKHPSNAAWVCDGVSPKSAGKNKL